MSLDYLQSGQGPHLILIHSSVAGAGQWRRLMSDASANYETVAVNLFGYGATPPYNAPPDQSLADQAALMDDLVGSATDPVRVVGHSFGGSVAMKLAARHPTRIARLVLIEPNPFYLLAQNGRAAAYAEAVALRDCIKLNGAAAMWEAAAAVFADYWTGPGSWDAMPPDRRSKFAMALQPNFHEWDAVMNETTALHEWGDLLPKATTLICSRDTVRSIREIVDLFRDACPDWRFEDLPEGGHMAALSRPDLVNPRVLAALQ
jgi:pimeloyl-ACP methyl ester carboxylesterase